MSKLTLALFVLVKKNELLFSLVGSRGRNLYHQISTADCRKASVSSHYNLPNETGYAMHS